MGYDNDPLDMLVDTDPLKLRDLAIGMRQRIERMELAARQFQEWLDEEVASAEKDSSRAGEADQGLWLAECQARRNAYRDAQRAFTARWERTP